MGRVPLGQMGRPVPVGQEAEPVEDEWELYNLSTDPEERHPLDAGGEAGRALARLLESQRDAKRLVPRFRNPG